MGNVILHENVDSVTHLANLEDFWVILFFFFLFGLKLEVAYENKVFVPNTKVYIPAWYLVFLLFTNTSFKYTVETC